MQPPFLKKTKPKDSLIDLNLIDIKSRVGFIPEGLSESEAETDDRSVSVSASASDTATVLIPTIKKKAKATPIYFFIF